MLCKTNWDNCFYSLVDQCISTDCEEWKSTLTWVVVCEEKCSLNVPIFIGQMLLTVWHLNRFNRLNAENLARARILYTNETKKNTHKFDGLKHNIITRNCIKINDFSTRLSKILDRLWMLMTVVWCLCLMRNRCFFLIA